MSLSKISSRLSTTALARCRQSASSFSRHDTKRFHSLLSSSGFNDKGAWRQVSFLHQPAINSLLLQRFRFSSSASPQPNQKETGQSGNGHEKGNDGAAPAQSNEKKENNEAAPNSSHQAETSYSDGTSESDLESDLSKDDLVKLVAEKEQLLMAKQEELNQMKDKVLRTMAEMENVMDRTRRESENAKKFAIQNFAKGLLDVADNLGRASSAAKESYSKIDSSKDTTGAVQQLKTLLEGVEMTEKQLIEVFKKFGVEKYNPVDEEFDPNRHNAVFQVPDASKPAGHVAVVLKAGYVLHERVIRPAEVGVTVAVENEEPEA